MKYNLIITDSAADDLVRIVDYIASDSIANANKFHDEIIKTLSKLINTPFIGYESKIKKLRLMGYRNLVIGNYLAYYIVNESKTEVQIIRIIHGARKQEKQFK